MSSSKIEKNREGEIEKNINYSYQGEKHGILLQTLKLYISGTLEEINEILEKS